MAHPLPTKLFLGTFKTNQNESNAMKAGLDNSAFNKEQS